MDNIKISELSNEELLDVYKIIKEFLDFLESEKQKEEKPEEIL